MSKFCPHCGNKLPDDAVFCNRCGTRQKDKSNPAYFPEKPAAFHGQKAAFKENTFPEEPLEQLFLKKEGRLNRKPFMKGIAVLYGGIILIEVLAAAVMHILDRGNILRDENFVICYSLYALLQLLTAYPEFCLITRRLKDLDVRRVVNAAWLITAVNVASVFAGMAGLLSRVSGRGTGGHWTAVCLLYVLLLLLLMALKGTPGPNRYGPDPFDPLQQSLPARQETLEPENTRLLLKIWRILCQFGVAVLGLLTIIGCGKLFLEGMHPAAKVPYAHHGILVEQPQQKTLSPQELSQKLAYYKNEKSKYDQKIVDFASSVNQHLQVSPDFRQTTFGEQGRNLNKQILQVKSQLQQDTSIPDTNRDKQLLLQLFDLESRRIMGMVEGIEASSRGGDYRGGFSKGTDASYQFDDVNKQLNP